MGWPAPDQIAHVNARVTYGQGWTGMASGNNRKTTRSKLDRERKLVERRHQKATKRQVRKEASAQARALDRDGVADDS